MKQVQNNDDRQGIEEVVEEAEVKDINITCQQDSNVAPPPKREDNNRAAIKELQLSILLTTTPHDSGTHTI